MGRFSPILAGRLGPFYCIRFLGVKRFSSVPGLILCSFDSL